MKKSLSIFAILLLLLGMSPLYALGEDGEKICGAYTYIVKNDTAAITAYSGEGGNLIIPDTLDGIPVAEIGENAFIFNTTLLSVTLPGGLTSIGNNAFTGCTALTSAVLPEGLLHIGNSAFANCCAMVSAVLPEGLLSIGYNAFYNCEALQSVVFPQSLQFIDSQAYYHCASITEIALPKGLADIGFHVFSGCVSLDSVTIPDSFPNLFDNARRYCQSLATMSRETVGGDTYTYYILDESGAVITGYSGTGRRSVGSGDAGRTSGR